MSDLAAAINRAYHAWIRTQPQLILGLWDDGGLDEPQQRGGDAMALRLIEPAHSETGDDPPLNRSWRGSTGRHGVADGASAVASPIHLPGG